MQPQIISTNTQVPALLSPCTQERLNTIMHTCKNSYVVFQVISYFAMKLCFKYLIWCIGALLLLPVSMQHQQLTVSRIRKHGSNHLLKKIVVQIQPHRLTTIQLHKAENSLKQSPCGDKSKPTQL